MTENFSFDTIKNRFNNDKRFKMITYVVGGILVLVLAGLAYYQFVWKSTNDKSKDAYWKGLNYAAKDSTNLAITELTKRNTTAILEERLLNLFWRDNSWRKGNLKKR